MPSLEFCRHGGRKDYESPTDMLSQRPELADSLITHRFPIEDAAEAFRSPPTNRPVRSASYSSRNPDSHPTNTHSYQLK